MIEQPLIKEENLIIIKEIESYPAITQRDLSKKLSVSLGKVNYLLKELIKKGLIEVRNFSNNPGKMSKIQYHLTREGIEYKIRITRYFLSEKEAEYNYLKSELERSLSENPIDKKELLQGK